MQSASQASSRRQCRRSRRRSRTSRASSYRPGAQQRRDPGLLDDLALRVGAAEPPDLRAEGGQPVGGGRAAALGHQLHRAGQRGDDLGVGPVAVALGPGGQPLEAGGVVERQQRDGGVHAQERRGRPGEAAVVDGAGDLLHRGHVVGARGQRPAPEQRAGVHEGPAAEAVLRSQLALVAGADRVEVAEGQLVQGGVPGEVAQAVGRGAVADDPLVHPRQAADVVAGLVVRVRPGVRGVPGVGLVRPARCRPGPSPRRSGPAPGA